MSPGYSPLYGLENLAAGVAVEAVLPDRGLRVDGFEVTAVAVPHGNMQALAFRITADGTTAVYISDVEYPASGPPGDVLALAQGADVLIHDAMYSDEEYRMRRGWGHSSVSAAIQVAEQARVQRLVLFHHNPDATDDAIDALVARARTQTDVPLLAAAEGLDLDL